MRPTSIPLFLTLLMAYSISQAITQDGLNGREIMEQVYKRHEQFPHVYEEQVMVLIDKAGKKDTRTLRRYSRINAHHDAYNLLIFDDPPEVRGVGLLTHKTSDSFSTQIYLPAYGPQLIDNVSSNANNNFLGTDFSVNDLLPENLDQHLYIRKENRIFENIEHMVVDVYPTSGKPEASDPLRTHFIRTDLYFITRTDSYDPHGRPHKRQTRHDLKHLGGHLWRADMILMEDLKSEHQTLLKISRRVFSEDYVPQNLFSLDWLINNQPAVEAAPKDSSENMNKATLQVSQNRSNQ